MNDDTLLLYYYNDGLSTRERRQVEARINTDAEIAAQYEALCQQLNAMDDRKLQAVPTHAVQRWHDSIDRAAQQDRVRQSRPSGSFNLFSFAWGAAFAATLAVGIGIGVYFSAPPVTAPTGVAQSLATPAAFTRGVSMYLRDTHQELTTLPANATADRTALVLQIIEQNRLFERAAEQNNSQSLARVLRAFEPILLRLAADDIAPEDAEALRAQLAFELNVMLTKLSRDASKDSQST
jgi:anti-sigma-K factor RskA